MQCILWLVLRKPYGKWRFDELFKKRATPKTGLPLYHILCTWPRCDAHSLRQRCFQASLLLHVYTCLSLWRQWYGARLILRWDRCKYYWFRWDIIIRDMLRAAAEVFYIITPPSILGERFVTVNYDIMILICIHTAHYELLFDAISASSMRAGGRGSFGNTLSPHDSIDLMILMPLMPMPPPRRCFMAETRACQHNNNFQRVNTFGRLGYTLKLRFIYRGHYYAKAKVSPYEWCIAIYNLPTPMMCNFIVARDKHLMIYNTIGRAAEWRFYFRHVPRRPPCFIMLRF